MNVVLLFFLLLFSKSVLGSDLPQVTIYILKQPPSFIYYGETLRLPISLNFKNLRYFMHWELPEGSTLQIDNGYCPPIPDANSTYWNGTCYLTLIIPGDTLGKNIRGRLKYIVSGKEKKPSSALFLSDGEINITVLPHCPSMLTTSPQRATANQNFLLHLKQFVQYYDENVKANTPPQFVVTPNEQDGLHYDATQLAIVGKPTRLGIYHFTIGTTNNSRCLTQPTTLNIMVQANPQDKPVIKTLPSLIAGFPGQKYSMNLLELIEQQTGLMISNQASFRIDRNMPHPSWLTISSTDTTQLEGIVPKESAGKTEDITLIASTNTGGDSDPLTLHIPIAYDPDKQPVVDNFTLHEKAGNEFYYDITQHVKNTGSSPFELVIDKTEPRINWLSHDKTTLHGLVPIDATGEKVQITLRVSTKDGGSSEPVIVPLQVDIDERATPYFKELALILPKVIPGQPYFYDFFEHHVIYPDNIPYQIEWASEDLYPHPEWIELKNNQLIVKEVPDINESEIPLYLIIKNTPGGTSKITEIDLFVHSLKKSIRTDP